MRVILSSWKEIAKHLGKGVRTVQRWERELDMPIYRPLPERKQIIFAYSDELDRWIQQQTATTDGPQVGGQQKILKIRHHRSTTHAA
jgi:hypothetical protein